MTSLKNLTLAFMMGASTVCAETAPGFSQMAAEVPAVLFDDGRDFGLSYTNTQALSALLASAEDMPFPPPDMAFIMGARDLWVGSVAVATDDAGAFLGFPAEQVGAVLNTTTLFEDAVVFAVDGDIPESFYDLRRTHGFAPRTRHGETIWARGEDGNVEIREDRKSDLFGNGLGMSARLWVQDDRLIYTVNWSEIDAFIQTDAPSILKIDGTRAVLDSLTVMEQDQGGAIMAGLWGGLSARGAGANAAVAAWLPPIEEGTNRAVLLLAVPDGYTAADYADIVRRGFETRSSQYGGMPLVDVAPQGSTIDITSISTPAPVVVLTVTSDGQSLMSINIGNAQNDAYMLLRRWVDDGAIWDILPR